MRVIPGAVLGWDMGAALAMARALGVAPLIAAELLSLRNVEDLLHERGIEINHETVRFWWLRFGPIFAADIRRRRI